MASPEISPHIHPDTFYYPTEGMVPTNELQDTPDTSLSKGVGRSAVNHSFEAYISETDGYIINDPYSQLERPSPATYEENDPYQPI